MSWRALMATGRGETAPVSNISKISNNAASAVIEKNFALFANIAPGNQTSKTLYLSSRTIISNHYRPGTIARMRERDPARLRALNEMEDRLCKEWIAHEESGSGPPLAVYREALHEWVSDWLRAINQVVQDMPHEDGSS